MIFQDQGLLSKNWIKNNADIDLSLADELEKFEKEYDRPC